MKPTRDQVADSIIKNLEAEVGQIHESEGSNRSPAIDAFEKRAGVAMGLPYCLSGALCMVDDACRANGWRNPVGVHAGTQVFFDAAPRKYLFYHALRGMIGIARHTDPTKGHAMTVVKDQDSPFSSFETIEFNTDIAGSRDGDGCYRKTRRMPVDGDLALRGFIDVAQWIVDAN